MKAGQEAVLENKWNDKVDDHTDDKVAKKES